MEIYKRAGSPYWMLDTVDPVTGSRVRKSTGEKDKRAAQKRAQVILAELAAKPTAVNGKPAIAVADALERYVARLAASGAASAPEQAYLQRKLLGRDAGPLAGRWKLPAGLLLHGITPALLDDLVTARRAEGNSAQTIAHELKLLRAATLHAKRLRFAAPDIDKWGLPATKPKLRYLSTEEWARLFDYMDPNRPLTRVNKRTGEPISYPADGTVRAGRQDARDLLVALTLTGGRWSEVARLTWEMIDTETWETARLWGSKTDAERVVGLPAQAVEVLKRRWAARDAAEPYIFPGRNGGPRTSSSQAILKAMTGAGLNRPDLVAQYGRATIHSLRHTYASWLLQRGADLSEVQQALGHTTLQMTRRYAHLGKTATARKMSRLLENAG